MLVLLPTLCLNSEHSCIPGLHWPPNQALTTRFSSIWVLMVVLFPAPTFPGFLKAEGINHPPIKAPIIFEIPCLEKGYVLNQSMESKMKTCYQL